MKMNNLQLLHQSMMSKNVDIQQFRIVTGAASFDCLFSVREAPFVLTLTSRGLSPKFFKFDVKKGYWITPYFKDFFYELVEVLSTNSKSKVRLEPKKFLEQVNSVIPKVAKVDKVPSTDQIIKLRLDILEKREKRFFDTWIYWKSEERPGPSKENLQKTKSVLGKDALEHSISMRASSRWSVTDLGNDWKSQCR